MIDIDFVRAQFPAFSDPSLDGWGFFENAGGSFAAGSVIERLTNYYQKNKVQPYAPYPASTSAGEQMDESYVRLAEYLNVDAGDLHFGPSTSQNTYVLAQAFRHDWQEGDEIIVTNQDHEANIGAWRRLSDSGIVVREWKVNEHTGELSIDDLPPLINDRTKLLAFTHCSNIVAHINPVRDICQIAKDADVVTVVDGVSYAGHGFPDVNELGCDVYLFSLYKTFGPHQGLMVVKEPVRSELANQGHFFNNGESRKRIVPAGPDHAQVAAAAGIADYFDAVFDHHVSKKEVTPTNRRAFVHHLLRAHEKNLLQPLLDYCSELDGVRLIGPSDAEQRAPTVALDVGKNSHEWVKKLSDAKVMCSAGHFYAQRLVNAINLPIDSGVLRLSFLHYTSTEEVQHLIRSLDSVAAQMRKL